MKITLSLKVSAGLVGLLFLRAQTHAAPRIKTVEFVFGSHAGTGTSGGEIASGVAWRPNTISADLPETGKTIRSAWLEIYSHHSNAAMSDVAVRFDAAANPTTVRDDITAYSNNSGESYVTRALVDVTAVIAAVGAWPSSFSMDVSYTGPTSNTHSAKLHVTYEHDDQAANYANTVRFPLFTNDGGADGGAGRYLATRSTQVAAGGTHLFAFNAEIGETAPTIQQAWFEIWGFQQCSNNSNDAGVRAGINGQAAGNDLLLDCAARTDRWFVYYATKSATPAALNTRYTVDVLASKAVNVLGGELVVTYTGAKASAIKTKTVRRLIGQGVTRAAASAFAPIYPAYKERGFNPKQIYAKLTGSYGATAAVSPSVTSSVDGLAVTARAYTIQKALAASLDYYVVFHSLNERLSALQDEKPVDLDYSAVASNGGMGVELVTTYQYAGDDEYTTYYELFGGQKAVADTATDLSGGFTARFPEPRPYRALRGAWVEGWWVAYAAPASANTKDVDTMTGGQAADSVQVGHGIESDALSVFRDASGQVTDADAAAYTTTQSNGATAQNAAYNITAKIVYTVVYTSAAVANAAAVRGPNSGKAPLLKLVAWNMRPAGYAGVEISQFSFRLTQGDAGPTNLTLAQAQSLFSNLYVYRDNTGAGSLGTYQRDYDTAAVGTATNAQLAAAFAGGVLTFSQALGTLNNPDMDGNLQLGLGASATYFLVAQLQANADVQSPNVFGASLDAEGSEVVSGTVAFRDAGSNVSVRSSTASRVDSQQALAYAPASGASGFTPSNVGAAVYTIPVMGDDGRIYVAAANGTVARVDPAGGGAPEWTYPAGSGIRASLAAAGGSFPPPPYDDLYFGKDNGDVVRINGNGSVPVWTRAGLIQVRSAPIFNGTNVFVGAADNKLYKLKNSDGTDEAGYVPQDLGGGVVGTPTLFAGTLYIGAQSAGSSFYAINAGNGTPSGSLAAGQVSASPFIATFLSGNIFFGSTSGTLYSRNGATLTTPGPWADYAVPGSPAIETSPFVAREGANKMVYFGTSDGKLYKLNAVTGAFVWAFPAGSARLGRIVSGPILNSTLDPTYLVFGTDDGELWVLKNITAVPTAETGYPVLVGAEVAGSPMIDTGSSPNPVYFASLDGKVYRYNVTP